MERKIKKTSLILFCIYIAAVLALCLMKADDLPELPRTILGIPLDKFTHFLIFLPFPFLGYTTFYPTKDSAWRKFAVLFLTCILGCAFALATERLQALTEHRSYESADMLADWTGIAIGFISVTIHIFLKDK